MTVRGELIWGVSQRKGEVRSPEKNMAVSNTVCDPNSVRAQGSAPEDELFVGLRRLAVGEACYKGSSRTKASD